MNPRENHLGQKKKGYRFHFQELENPFACRMNLPQDLKTQKMPLFHIGRLLRNEAKRKSSWTEEEGLQALLPRAEESFDL